MGFSSLSPWHVLIVVAVFVLLFGARKLPDAARSLGRSMRILKAETKALRDDDTGDEGRAGILRGTRIENEHLIDVDTRLGSRGVNDGGHVAVLC